MPAPRPPNEAARLAALLELGVLDTPPEVALDALVRLASQIFAVPVSLVSLVDAERQWFKAKVGLEVSETPRDLAFCAHAILSDEVMVVPDATLDLRFRDNPLVTSRPSIRFYAGAPLATSAGEKLGTLCIIDHEPRRLTEREKEILAVLARAVTAHLELGAAVRHANAAMEARHLAEARLRQASWLQKTMHEAESDLLRGRGLSETFDHVLRVLLELTRSEYGFIGEVLVAPDGQPYLKTHAITNIAWNDETRRFYAENAPKGMEFTNLETLFGAVMTSGTSVIANDPASDPRRGGLPPGHPALNSFLGVPFSSDPSGKPLSGMLGIANAPGGYREETIELIRPLLDACATMVGYAKLQRSRQAAEAALRASEERHRLVLEHALDAVVSVDSGGRVQIWNRQAEAIFGWSESEARGRTLDQLIVPERFREGHRQGISQYLGTQQSKMIGHRLELTALRRDGEEFPIELSISAVEGEQGTSFNAFLRDITERRRSENELRGLTSRLSALIRNLGAGLLVEDEQRRILLVNDELGRMFGIPGSPEQLIGADCAEAVRVLAGLFEKPEAFLREIQETLAARVLVHAQEVPLRDGRILERDYIPIYSGETYLGHMWQYRDVSQRKRAERELLERGNQLSAANAELSRASRLKDEFLAAMSHELRTPLNAVLGLSEGLRSGVFGEVSSLQREQITMIEDSGRHLLELINDVLDLSKVEAGKLQLRIEEVGVDAVCQASLRMVKEAALQKQLRVVTSFDGALAVVEADPRRLKQILVNLLSNAVKFSERGGTVGLETALDREAGEARFVVWDTGIGIAEEDLPRLFKPFVQLDSSLARRHAGTGLGLSLVSQLAELHGGGVAVESAPGRGSRFTLRLPAAQPPEVREMASPARSDPRTSEIGAREVGAAAESGAEGPLLLLAEDQEINVRTVSAYLRSRGYRVAVARNGREAVARTRSERPALVLMDIQMPEMDGLQAMSELRRDEATAGIPIIALTALAMAGDRERCLAAGADEYLSKPVRLSELDRLVSRLVAGGPSAAL